VNPRKRLPHAEAGQTLLRGLADGARERLARRAEAYIRRAAEDAGCLLVSRAYSIRSLT